MQFPCHILAKSKSLTWWIIIFEQRALCGGIMICLVFSFDFAFLLFVVLEVWMRRIPQQPFRERYLRQCPFQDLRCRDMMHWL